MGAWGYGLLQNDASQDGLCHIHDEIETDIVKLARRRPAEPMAGRLAGGVGLLLHLNAHWSFNNENAFVGQLQAALARQEPMFYALPRRAATMLRELHRNSDIGLQWVARTGRLDRQLHAGFFDWSSGFIMERRMGRRESVLFEHPESAKYVQQVAERCLRRVRAGFRERNRARDLSRQAGLTIASLATMLIIEPCQINPDHLRDCWEQYRAANIGIDYGEDEEFERAYRNCLRATLTAGIRKFSNGEEPEPLMEVLS